MYVHVCICMYVYVFVCICMCIKVQIYTSIPLSIYIYTYSTYDVNFRVANGTTSAVPRFDVQVLKKNTNIVLTFILDHS